MPTVTIVMPAADAPTRSLARFRSVSGIPKARNQNHTGEPGGWRSMMPRRQRVIARSQRTVGITQASTKSVFRIVVGLTRIRHQDRRVGFTPQKLRVLAACSGSRLTESFDRSPFPGNSFDPERAGRRGLDTLRSHAAYLGGLCRKRGGLYHEGNIRSAGLLTAAGPRFRTCVYTIVVLTSRCPSSS